MVTLETITPAKARKYLKSQLINRKLKPTHVESLRRDIAAGQWAVNGETIKFTTTGALVDGQHRLLACIQANMPLKTYVVRDIADEGVINIDTGIKRSPGDIFGLLGYKNSNDLSAALRWIWRYENGYMVGYPYKPQISELLEVEMRYGTLKESLNYGQLTQRFLVKSLGSALHCLFARRDAQSTSELFEAIAAGEGLFKEHVLYKLRKRLVDNVTSKAKLPAYEIAALVIKAFNAHRAGRTIRYLRWITQGESMEPFPTIE